MVAAGDPIYASDINNLAARVFVTGIGITASTTGVGSTETVALTVPSYTYKANSAYALHFHGGVSVSANPPASIGGSNFLNRTLFRFRKTNASGQQLDVCRMIHTNQESTGLSYECVFQVGSSDITTALALTITGGTTWNSNISAGATSPAGVDVYRVGAEGGAPAAITAYAPTLV